MALPMPFIPLGAAGEEPCDPGGAVRVVLPAAIITSSPAASEPLSGVTAACVPLTRSMRTRTGFGLPFASTNSSPVLPAVTFAAPADAVCPHGEAALPEADGAATFVAVAALRRCESCDAPEGRKLNDWTGTTRALRAVCTPIVAFAVIPGNNLFCGLSTSVMTVYVTTLLTVVGFSRTCDTTPLNVWLG